METEMIILLGLSLIALGVTGFIAWRGSRTNGSALQPMEIVRQRMAQLRASNTLVNRRALADSFFEAGLFNRALEHYRDCVDERGQMADEVVDRIDEIGLALEHLEEYPVEALEPQISADVIDLDDEKTVALSDFVETRATTGSRLH